MKKIKFKRILEGKRITLRQMRPSIKFATELFDLVDKNRGHLLPWLQWVHKIKKVEDEYDGLVKMRREWDAAQTASYGLYIKSKLAGAVDMHGINFDNERGEIGYWIDEDYAGRGYTSEAVAILEDYFFGGLGFNRIVIKCDKDNKASAGVAKRNGYKLEGTAREAIHYKGHERYSDLLTFSKLKREWKKGK
jgi:ribosomal-protein-serine acetyltransferase